jgi:hypothetical protein
MTLQNLRKVPRRKTWLGGRIFDGSGEGRDCLVRDFSSTGVRVRSALDLDPGHDVEIKIAKFDDLRHAVVIWSHNGSMGLRFVAEIRKIPHTMRRFFGILGLTE